jgi:hypothetical protein
MGDDLVKQAREASDSCELSTGYMWLISTMADRIEKLEEENGVLFVANIRLNSRADLDSDGYVDRIEKLEAALREIAAGYETPWSTSTVTNMLNVAEILSERINIARKALEGENGVSNG